MIRAEAQTEHFTFARNALEHETDSDFAILFKVPFILKMNEVKSEGNKIFHKKSRDCELITPSRGQGETSLPH